MASNSRDEILRFVYETQGQEGLDQVNEIFAKLDKQGGETSDAVNKLADQLTALFEKTRQVESLQDLQDKLTGVDEKLAQAKTGLEQLNATYSATDKSSAAVAAQFATANKAIADLTEQHNLLTVRVSASTAALNAAGVDTRDLGKAHEDLAQKASTTASKLAEAAESANRGGLSFRTIKETAAQAGESLKSSAEQAAEFGKKLGEITGIAGVVSGALGTIAGVKFFERGVEEARSGEVALAKLQAAVGGNIESFEKLKEAAEHAADSVGTTSNVAVETATKLTSLLGSVDAAAKALPATLTLAKAAQIDFSESAELVATTLKAFGLEADHAGEVADKLASIASRTGANLAELARTAAQLAPLAKEAGVGFDGVASALAELASKGFDAQKSNAGLRELFLALSQPTSKLRQDLVGLGIDTHSLGSILDGLRAAGDRGTEALQQLSAKGRAAVQALVQGGSADLRNFQNILDESAGSASKTAKLLGDTFDGAVTAFGRAVDNLAEDAVKGALPAVKDEIKKLGDELKEVSKTDAFDKIKSSIRDFVTASVKAFDEFIHSVDWSELGKTITDFAKSAADSMKSFRDSVSGSTSAVKNFASDVSTSFSVAQTSLDYIGLAIKSTMYYIFAGLEKAAEGLSYFRADAAAAAAKYREIKDQYAADYKELSDEIEKNSQKVKAALEEQEKQTKKTADAASDAVPNHEDHAKALSTVATAATNAAAAEDKHSASLGKANDAAIKANDQQGLLIAKMRDAAKEYVDASANLENLERNASATGEQLAAAKVHVEESGKAYADLAEQTNKAGINITKLPDVLNPLIEQLKRARQELFDSSAAFKQLQADESATAEQLANAEARFERAGDVVHALAAEVVEAGLALKAFGDGIPSSTLPNLDALERKMRETSISAGDLKAAAAGLGITLQSDLSNHAAALANDFATISAASKGTAADLANVRNAFLAYAKAQLDAVKDLDQGTKDSTQYMLESKASALGLTDQFAKLEQQTLGVGDASNKAAGGIYGASQAMSDAEVKAEKFDAALRTLRDSTASVEDKMKALAAAEESAGNAADKAAVAAEGVETRMHAAAGASVTLASSMLEARQQFAGNEMALREFDRGMADAAESAGTFSNYLEMLTNVTNQVRRDFPTAADQANNFKVSLDRTAASAKNLTDNVTAAAAASQQFAASGNKQSTQSGGASSNAISNNTSSSTVVNLNTTVQVQLPGASKSLAAMSQSDITALAQQLIPIMMPDLMHEIVYQLQLAKARA